MFGKYEHEKKQEGSIPRAGEGKQPAWGHKITAQGGTENKNIWVLGWHPVLAHYNRTLRECSFLIFNGLIYASRDKVEATESI